MDELKALLQPLLMTVIQVLAPIVLALVAAWLRQMLVKAQLSIGYDRWRTLEHLARTFVTAAEATGLAEGVQKTGAAKKAEVLALLQAEVDKRGIPVDLKTLDALIEAAVAEEFNYGKLHPTAGGE